MILTEQEIKAINWMQGGLQFARAIESAVLEKLKAQEPVAWLTEDKQDGEIGMDVEGSPATLGWTESFPVYRHPLPPADVVRVAELEAVLRECRRAFDYYDCNIEQWSVAEERKLRKEAIAKIDEVLNEDR